jgi:alpha-mannosidase
LGFLKSEVEKQLETVERRLQSLAGLHFDRRLAIADVAWRTTRKCEPVTEAVRGGYRRCRLPAGWGRRPETVWIRLRFAIPRDWRGRRVLLRARPDGEAVVFRGGVPVQGLDPNRDEMLLTGRARGGERCELFIEAGARDAFGKHKPRVFQYAELVTVLEEVRAAWFDLDTLWNLARNLPGATERRGRLAAALNDAVRDCPLDGSATELTAWAARARRALRPHLAARNGTNAVELSLHGHAHIDVAWLWTLGETVRKCSRTFSTAVRLLEQYPEYVFSQSQMQLYEYTRRHYPGLYRKIVRHIRRGHWEVLGGMWVEADCNCAGGESLVRQILHGKRFMRERFGLGTKVCWLPDAFGFPASIPQILLKGGLSRFFTIKVDWSDTNLFPYNSFWWKGLDGSRVLTHLGPNQANYNGVVRSDQLLASRKFLLERDPAGGAGLFSFGYGDGGGGPTWQMLEFARRARDLEGLPRTRMERADRFFDRLAAEGRRLPEWEGDLYFEGHRGTYTTQARNKRANRKSELALRGAELWCSLAHAAGRHYPARELDEAWKLVLLNQFHDVLPGSSIGEVYRESQEQYAAVANAARGLTESALADLAGRLDTRGPGHPVLVTNPLSWPRGGAVEIPAAAGASRVVDDTGAELAVQRSGGRLLALARPAGVPAMGAAVWRMLSGRSVRRPNPLRAEPRLLENELLRVRLDGRGTITSIHDKASGREVLPRGARANVLQLFHDRPRNWDAWDIDEEALESGREVTEIDSLRAVEHGPVRAALRMVRRFGASRLEQEVRLAAGSPVIEFVTRVDWRESHRLLKVAFPVDVRAPRGTCEVQFGAVERATHRSSSWDRARFEVPLHRWADLSEPDWGGSLLNDCKYGGDLAGQTLRLSLLRAPASPDPQADRGRHEFTYAFYPHAGDWRRALTVRRALELNVPLTAAPAPAGRRGALERSVSFLSFDAENVVIDTVKQAEDSADLVVRLYEAHGSRAAGRLRLALPVKSARETDLLEKNGRPLRVLPRAGAVEVPLRLRPFEIKTVVLGLRR